MPGTWVAALILIPLLVFYGLVVWQRERIAQAHQFLGEVKAELKKVRWPGRREVLNTTSVVILTVFFFGIYLTLIDAVVTWARTLLFSAAGINRGPTL